MLVAIDKTKRGGKRKDDWMIEDRFLIGGNGYVMREGEKERSIAKYNNKREGSKNRGKRREEGMGRCPGHAVPYRTIHVCMFKETLILVYCTVRYGMRSAVPLGA